MEIKEKYLSIPAIVFSLLAFIFAIASFLTFSKSYAGVAANIIFWSSIVTTCSAIIAPLLSIKRFNLDSYKVKLYSLLFGIIVLIMLFFLDAYSLGIINELKSFANKGLIWGLNTALLLLNLTYLEIENHDLKNQEIIKTLLEKQEQLKEEKEKRTVDRQKLIESQKEILKLQRELLNMKKKEASKGDEK